MMENGNIVSWITRGLPDLWHVIVNESRGPKYQEFDCDMEIFWREYCLERKSAKYFRMDFLQNK